MDNKGKIPQFFFESVLLVGLALLIKSDVIPYKRTILFIADQLQIWKRKELKQSFGIPYFLVYLLYPSIELRSDIGSHN
jgi:hypothetical protein